ncbi:MAG: outer membrane beta-barrel protein [Kiritimatiellae bacterium]|nr:outer membrane beta-barrel protein [Kiritimatiellia bacterium]
MKKLCFIAAVAALSVAQADVMDRPTGFKVGQRMTVRPYVSLYYTFDSNVDSAHHSSSRSGSSWSINPGFTADYKGENWNLAAGAYYRHHDYTRNSSNMDQNSYGQNLALTWATGRDGGKGWSLNIRESFQFISQDDDMSNHDGRGIGRDRQQFQLGATLQRRFNERWHASADATYYYLDYENDSKKYAPLYGWTRWTVGGQAGYVASRWTDLLIAANYQGYTQDNDRDRYSEAGEKRGRRIASDSKGWTVHVGVGTHATERISYRVMAGWSRFEYGDGAHDADGFTYSITGNWKMSDTWHMMLLASSYYQPSEREYGSETRTDLVSWGLAHTMIRGKLNATFDLNYRHEQHEYTEYRSSDYDCDILTGRIGLNYTLNRFLTAFTTAEYQTYMSHDRSNYDYDRWRLSLGLRLTY